ncbi:Glycosyl transferase CAP10 domain [Dillenia turbinata]|uniref:Glycosyl transferase CAP10 domain n=1 Tax=Dillenia turbinata TaxID=194707 RepID=A0AAN8UY42_9MAGN
MLNKENEKTFHETQEKLQAELKVKLKKKQKSEVFFNDTKAKHNHMFPHFIAPLVCESNEVNESNRRQKRKSSMCKFCRSNRTASEERCISSCSALISSQWIDASFITGASTRKAIFSSKGSKRAPLQLEFPLNCTNGNVNLTRPTNYPEAFETYVSSEEECPDYFKWIYEDLRPWQKTGITRDMVERAKDAAHIRIIVVDGKVYFEKYKWLLRSYPGKLPDLDLMFEYGDRPVIAAGDNQGAKANTSPPALFHYCGDDRTVDIVFPDWSFWGWPEINIKPWEALRKDLEEGSNKTKWIDREPYAFWRGNIRTGNRMELERCNPTDKQDWNARIFNLHAKSWFCRTGGKRLEKGSGARTYRTNAPTGVELKLALRLLVSSVLLIMDLSCRYKIYTEGEAWSVSEKYILSCDSVTMLIKTNYYDFFTRSLLPLKHYWPINDKDKCRSIKFAVDWGNNHMEQAQEIGKAGRRFIQEELKMGHVYDYMFHLLKGYGKLLKYKPMVTPGAVEVWSETMASNSQGLEKIYKVDTMVKRPAVTSPCTMPRPFDLPELEAFKRRKEDLMKQVEIWEANGVVGEDINLRNILEKA